MNRLVLADNQFIFRAGVARVLTKEENLRIVAQCDDEPRLLNAIRAFPSSILVVSCSMCDDLSRILAAAAEARSRVILVLENGKAPDPEIVRSVYGTCNRNVTGQELSACVRKVAAGQYCLQEPEVAQLRLADSVGTHTLHRLTPREIQVVRRIAQGCRNKDIAEQMHIKEQVVKNHLRNIYDKVGVSDRLELALFALHHRVVTEDDEPQEPIRKLPAAC